MKLAYILVFLVACGLFRSSEAASTTVSTKNTSPLRVVLFHSGTCKECVKTEKALPKILDRWGNRISLEKHRLGEVEGFKELILYEDHYGVEVNYPPVIFVGGQCISGDEEIANHLGEIIEQELAAGAVTFEVDEEASDSSPASDLQTQPATTQTGSASPDETLPPEILQRFEGFSVGAVAVAGLVDGINPCAFTTIVFLLSMLAYLGKSKQQLAVVGAGFTTAVFITYFLLGLGLLGAIKVFAVSRGLSAALAYSVGGLALLLAAWSLVDFVRYLRSGDTQKVTLGLPKAVKARIHRVIRVGLSTRGLVVGSFSVGVVVALLESLCTGQVYLPTIMFVARAPGLRANAIGYLFLYNLLFIVPLVGILAIAYFGVRSERLGEFFRQHLAVFKFAMAIVFAGLGVLVILTA